LLAWEKLLEAPMLAKSKKTPSAKAPIKKTVLKHLKEDVKESKESIKDDKKLAKKMKKGGC
jgi:hypothetical protein